MFPDPATVESVGEAIDLAEVKGRSLWADARIRFFRNKAAVVSLAILIAVASFALFGSFFAQWKPATISALTAMGATFSHARCKALAFR
jgi:oligopeptide transport system permease protein